MTDTRLRQSLKSCLGGRMETGMLLLAIAFVLTIVTSPVANAQTFTVLHDFVGGLNGGLDGGLPHDITIDAAGNLYGSAECCGLIFGTVYNLQRFGTSWVFNPLYIFHGNDGDNPLAAVVFGPYGVLYSTADGGGQYSNGLVFSLGPASAACPCLRVPPNRNGVIQLRVFSRCSWAYGYFDLRSSRQHLWHCAVRTQWSRQRIRAHAVR